MLGDDFLSALKSAWRAAHNLIHPAVMSEARHILATEDLAGGLALLKKTGGRSV